MYAIVFDLNQADLEANYHNASCKNAYTDIAKALAPHGFSRQQGSVYFGDDTVNAVKAILAVQALSKQYAWFKASVTDIRMLRIEELNDLRPAL